MNVVVLAVGKAGRGPEADLGARYAERASRAGRALGIGPVTVREAADGSGPRRAEEEGARLLAMRPKGVLVVLDERGGRLTSAAFADQFAAWLGQGVPAVAFAIGGADGHPEAVRSAADRVMALSDLTLPHLLARALVLEQIYRAVTILAGHPYHRA